MMHWKIYNRRFDATFLMADIEIYPTNNPLRYAITQVRVKDYPEFITDVANSTSTGYEFVHFRFFNDADFDDHLWVKNIRGYRLREGEIFISHTVIGETIVEDHVFDKIIYDFASELLKVYANDEQLPITWQKDMQLSLIKLKDKIFRNEQNIAQ
jgi:hypothetical protein